MNKLLCSPDVPVEVVNYVIYHEMLHANGYWKHNPDFRNMEWKYPGSEEWDGFLDEMSERFELNYNAPKGTNHEKEKGNERVIELQSPVGLYEEFPKDKRKTVRKKYVGAAIIDNSCECQTS
ncbi:MAG: hypothetical protein P4L59_10010 [Desulfosporosinus sp.]|nr:hypothetical protein [Desulfosporosinus sp.]